MPGGGHYSNPRKWPLNTAGEPNGNRIVKQNSSIESKLAGNNFSVISPHPSTLIFASCINHERCKMDGAPPIIIVRGRGALKSSRCRPRIRYATRVLLFSCSISILCSSGTASSVSDEMLSRRRRLYNPPQTDSSESISMGGKSKNKSSLFIGSDNSPPSSVFSYSTSSPSLFGNDFPIHPQSRCTGFLGNCRKWKVNPLDRPLRFGSQSPHLFLH